MEYSASLHSIPQDDRKYHLRADGCAAPSVNSTTPYIGVVQRCRKRLPMEAMGRHQLPRRRLGGPEALAGKGSSTKRHAPGWATHIWPLGQMATKRAPNQNPS